MPFESRMNPSTTLHIHTADATLARSGNNAVHALKFSKLAVGVHRRAREGATRRQDGEHGADGLDLRAGQRLVSPVGHRGHVSNT